LSRSASKSNGSATSHFTVTSWRAVGSQSITRRRFSPTTPLTSPRAR
jgi:hypothetical protein